jgi:hypothetical protein
LPTESQRERIEVVLVEPRNPLNIGAAARAMANFGFRRLTVVSPFEEHWREAKSAVGIQCRLHLELPLFAMGSFLCLAAGLESYGVLFFALFVMAAGASRLETASNPFIAQLGALATSYRRSTFRRHSLGKLTSMKTSCEARKVYMSAHGWTEDPLVRTAEGVMGDHDSYSR